MITLLDLLQLILTLLGLIAGASVGAHFLGWPGGIGGGIAGAVAGCLIGDVPGFVTTRAVLRDIQRKSVDELRQMLRGPVWPAYHLFLAELVRRGEDVSDEFAVVRPLLVADDVVRRWHGVILRLYYPELAARVPDYRPDESAEVCRARVAQGGLLDVESDPMIAEERSEDGP